MFGYLVRFGFVRAVILHQHGAVLLHGVALTFFLRKLADIDLGDIALDRRLYEFLTVLVSLFGLRHRAGRGERARKTNG